MYSSLTAVVLCIATQVAAAQCVAPVPVAQHTRSGADLIKQKPAATVAAPPMAHAGGELIKTAAAGTHDDVTRVTRVTRSAAPASSGDDGHRRGGPAMLLAALALMSGIALRRFGADKR